MKAEKDLSGVEGWLALLVIFLTLRPLIGWGELTRQLEDAVKTSPQLALTVTWNNYVLYAKAVFWIQATLTVAAGYRLWKIHKPNSVLFAIVILWVTGPVDDLFFGWLDTTLFPTLVPLGYFQFVMGHAIGSVFFALIWTIYLKNSRRVRNTYQIQPA